MKKELQNDKQPHDINYVAVGDSTYSNATKVEIVESPKDDNGNVLTTSSTISYSLNYNIPTKDEDKMSENENDDVEKKNFTEMIKSAWIEVFSKVKNSLCSLLLFMLKPGFVIITIAFILVYSCTSWMISASKTYNESPFLEMNLSFSFVEDNDPFCEFLGRRKEMSLNDHYQFVYDCPNNQLKVVSCNHETESCEYVQVIIPES